MDPRERLRLSLLGAGCSRCGRPYDEKGIRVLAQRDEIAFVQLVCFACNIQTLALVTGLPNLRQESEEDAALEAEAPRGAGRPGGARPSTPISEDDVLAMHRYLADYEGDMRGLLGGSDERGRRDDGDGRSNGHGRTGRRG